MGVIQTIEKLPHLELPILPQSFPRKKKKGGGGYQKIERDKEKFYETEIKKFGELAQSLKMQKSKYRQFFDPHLIYKISVNQTVDEQDFVDNLHRMGINVISPSPDKRGYWIVFSADEEFKDFSRKLKDYADEVKRYQFFDAIDGITDIPPEEKIGELLQEKPIQEDESTNLDFSIWRMEDATLGRFLVGFQDFITKNDSRILDRFITKNFCKLKIKVNKKLLNEILSLREIEYVDRPPSFKIEQKLGSDFPDIEPKGKPSPESPGILIIDSGILPGHPLLEGAVGDAIAIATRYSGLIRDNEPYDEVGHGTQVAGVALYCDIEECIEKSNFIREFWIYSSKVMFPNIYGDADYDEEELIEHQLYSAVHRIIEPYPNCKIINISFGNAANRMSFTRRQYDIASLIDEMAHELNLIFVISAGNYYGYIDHVYPDYLLDDTIDDVKIIDTASSALGITVGALYREIVPHPFGQDYHYYPSPITRVGPGYQGMIKPDVVELGGAPRNPEGQIMTINPEWVTDHRLFTTNYGTSFSAPKIAHYFAQLMKEYPYYSKNLIIALLLACSSIPAPDERPNGFNEISSGETDERQMNLWKVYGYGKPNITNALFSDINRVLLIKQNRIKLNHIHIYPFFIPKEFIETKGNRSISISFSFDPPILKNRIDYLGAKFETHLFRNLQPENVATAYGQREVEIEEEDIVPASIRNNEIKLKPGINIRKKCAHQKCIIEFERSPQINSDIPLVLVVICQDRWIDNEKYEQDYGVVVKIEHSHLVDIYNAIRIRNAQRIELPISG